MRKLALFDLDNTLIPFDSDHAFGQYVAELGWVDAQQHREQNEAFYRQYKAGTLDLAAYLRFALQPIAGRDLDTLHAAHAAFMRDVVMPQIQPAARQLVERHKEAGDLCCIVTATNTFVTRPIADVFGVEHLIGVELERDGQGRYTGNWVGTPSFREGKIVRTEQWLGEQGLSWKDFDQIWFYSDSINDRPLLEHATHPVVVHPDPLLAAIAQEKGWPTLDLST
ncbi:histidinol-phosphatase [Thiomonas bhubaneswarensis]|uniref:HAD-superfamily subfamily IB hydrolase, TIGR01490 n=1 Tax=Thiomonas bhubaneswarensis TaxID=339866 RepID=A0A0K6I1Y5_9BURK|nr:HAD family phosphatase [Thiomonas bhubaneswarensis]CUA97081.1 HAD-superfamily subfamily IB hydrolase, TIGR01490 [Thiomonas bhubaneswarensis]